MTIPALERQVQQLFSFAELQRLDRLHEADVGFTFRQDELYLRLFGEAMGRLDENVSSESTPELLRCAQAFERFATTGFLGINSKSAAVLSAALYWLAGYTANARVLAHSLGMNTSYGSGPQRELVAVLSGDAFGATLAWSSPLIAALRRYVRSGEATDLALAQTEALRMAREAVSASSPSSFAAAHLLRSVLRRLGVVSLWGSLDAFPTAPRSVWRRYAATQMDDGRAMIDLWPSQRTAIRSGLVDGHSSLVLRMPTSAGKTKMTEIAFINDIFSGPRRCLYLAPFRALVSEIESSLGGALARLGIPVASLYGSSDANDIEVELTQRARVVIATPEKMSAVLRLGGGSLEDFDTIVIDEGHLLGSRSRGAGFELQLAALQAGLSLVDGNAPGSDEKQTAGETPPTAPTADEVSNPRLIFLSAVLPNSEEIAQWLGGNEGSLAQNDWHPTTTRIGILTWPTSSLPRLTFIGDIGAGDETFFVPRLFEQQEWRYRHPQTHRLRTVRFPERSQGSIAAAMAFRYAALGPVIVYAQQPRWAISIAETVLERLSQTQQPVDAKLLDDQNAQAAADLATFIDQRLGAESVLARAVRAGIGVHHGTVPQGIRLAIEDAFREGVLRLLIATNTIAQGVNFPARTVILHSLPRGDSPIRDFWNLAGRAGRALRETEGDVIVLQTGDLTTRTLNEFLDRKNVEPARSQILEFVEHVLGQYQLVSEETVRQLMESEQGKTWEPALRSVDTTLLEIMTEDLAGANEERFAKLVDALLATRQSQGRVDPDGEPLVDSVQAFLRIRKDHILSRVPSVTTRRRYARSGLSAAAAEAIDSRVESLKAAFPSARGLDETAFGELVTAACGAPELSALNPNFVAALGFTWITTGRYPAVRERAGEGLAAIDDTVSFVEEVLAYQLTWAITGLIRLVADTGQPTDTGAPGTNQVQLPEWLHLVPQFLQYGVAERELVWALSLGIQDRDFASWIVSRYSVERGGTPESFRALLGWALAERDTLTSAAKEVWPPYLAKLLARSLDRYEVIQAALESH